MDKKELAKELLSYTKNQTVILCNNQGCWFDEKYITTLDEAKKLIDRYNHDDGFTSILITKNGYLLTLRIIDNKIEIR